MELFDSTQHLLEGAMRGAAARQAALATNLSNANTAGYQRVDVDFHSVLRDAVADGSHEEIAAVGTEVEFTAETDGAATMRLDGGTVDLDVEAAELAQNGLEYQALVSAAHARIGILQSAMGVR